MSTAIIEAQGLHINRLEVENFLRVRALQVDAAGHHVVISGANGTGKTSAVEAIWAALKGTKAKDTPEPIHKGADRATIRLDLGEYVVTRHWTEKGTRLVVTAADGSQVSRPQELLDGLLSAYALDPVAFLQQRPQDQVDDVLAIVGVKPPRQQVREITGEDHEPLPGESADTYLMRLSADDHGLYYVRRREAHRVLTQKEAARAEQRRVCDQYPKPIERVSATEILQQIEELQRQADARRDAVQAAKDARQAHAEDAGKVVAMVRELEGHENSRMKLLAQMEDLRRQERDLQDVALALDAKITDARLIVDTLELEAVAAETVAAAMPDPAPQIQALRQQVAQVEETNQRHAAQGAATEQLVRLSTEVEKAAAEHRDWEDVLGCLRQLRARLLDGADLGVPGLEVGNGELRLNGVSFRQASQAEQIRTALAVAMRQKPRLRLLRLDDAEHLDAKSREMVLELASQQGFQVVMTCVRDHAGLQVEIVEAAA